MFAQWPCHILRLDYEGGAVEAVASIAPHSESRSRPVKFRGLLN
jgi:hypothetical protein